MQRKCKLFSVPLAFPLLTGPGKPPCRRAQSMLASHWPPEALLL